MATFIARARLVKSVLVVAGVLVALTAAEVALRMRPVRRPPSSLVVSAGPCGDCSQLYELTAGRPGVSSQGLRDREFSPTPEDGAYRVLVLGDSISYGLNVPAADAFPKTLERALRERHAQVEVLNGGVPGYGAYNEWRFYVERARRFRPNLVVLTFCMNDVADPVLHWASAFPDARRLINLVPDEAIPNADYHRSHAIPSLLETRRARNRMPARLLNQLALYRLAETALRPSEPGVTVASGGRSFPAYVVNEDTLSLRVLDDERSPEWTWLRSMYDHIATAVHEDGAALAIVVSPLSYQLDPAYPLHPEQRFASYCAERHLPCLDLLPVLREHRAEPLYLDKTRGYLDVWHYTSAGHALVGRAVAAFLEQQRLVP